MYLWRVLWNGPDGAPSSRLLYVYCRGCRRRVVPQPGVGASSSAEVPNLNYVSVYLKLTDRPPSHCSSSSTPEHLWTNIFISRSLALSANNNRALGSFKEQITVKIILFAIRNLIVTCGAGMVWSQREQQYSSQPATSPSIMSCLEWLFVILVTQARRCGCRLCCAVSISR